MTTLTLNDLKNHASQLALWGILANWDSVANEPWLPTLISLENSERSKRSLERRSKLAKLRNFKPFADFNWAHPKYLNKELIDRLFSLQFIADASNIIIVGNPGTGKTMIAKNLAHHALVNGYSVLFISASDLLKNLAAKDSGSSLSRRLAYYSKPDILVIDEIGYLSFSTQHADLLYEVINRRYQQKPIIITTNKPFSDWSSVFPSSSSIVALVDRLIHKADIISINADSYRYKEASTHAEQQNIQSASNSGIIEHTTPEVAQSQISQKHPINST